MEVGDTVILTAGNYKCSDGVCEANVRMMLFTDAMYGALKCVNDDASCYLDGEETRRLMDVKSTGGEKFTISAITFKDGHTFYGGGMYIYGGNVIVDLKFCVFLNCRATYSSMGGGALYVQHNMVTVNIFSTMFRNNVADSGDGADIYRDTWTQPPHGSVIYPIITIHDYCPVPYSSLSPMQGKLKSPKSMFLGRF